MQVMFMSVGVGSGWGECVMLLCNIFVCVDRVGRRQWFTFNVN